MNDVTSEIPSDQQLEAMIDSMRKGKLQVTQNKQPITIVKMLGGGGSKTVYDATLGESKFALALPNIVDGSFKVRKKWGNVLKEPTNTAKIRALEIPTNPNCIKMPVVVNGIPFTGLSLTRYQDLPYQILDGKNANSSTAINMLPTKLDRDKFTSLFPDVLNDLHKLIQNGVQLGSDSFNICVTDNGMRLYLNDLGTAQFEAFEDDELQEISETYARNATYTFINGLSEAEYQKNIDFFNGEDFKYNNPNKITTVLGNEVYAKLKHSD